MKERDGTICLFILQIHTTVMVGRVEVRRPGLHPALPPHVAELLSAVSKEVHYQEAGLKSGVRT